MAGFPGSANLSPMIETHHYTARSIAAIIDARGRPAGARTEQPVKHLLTDSRRVVHPEAAIFWALTGPRHDGHDYLAEAYRKGVRQFVVARAPEPGAFPEAAFWVVDDTLAALQRLAAHHRRQFRGPVVGITGSNGKTIVKEWLYQLLCHDRRVVRSPLSYNSQVGVPLSVWQLQPLQELAILEAGISQPGEMTRLERIIRPDIGLFTNIGPAHQEGFPDYETKIREKLTLFREAQVLLYCPDDERVARIVAELGLPALTWSRRRPADLNITAVQTRLGQTEITGRYRGAEKHIRIPFTDPASIENAIHCWAFLLYHSAEAATRFFPNLQPVAMRLELRAAINRCTLINDSYNTDLTSLNVALQFLEQQRPASPHTLILSDLLQSGIPPRQLYREVAHLIAGRPVDRVIGIGTAVRRLDDLLPGSVQRQFFPDTEAFLAGFPVDSFHDETILLKGARRFTFERIARRLSRQQHQTTLTVDLNALAHNLNVYYRQLRPGARLMAMVKASAYGSGSLELAKLLEFHKVSYLGVAYADEGVELRRGGIGLPILVLSPEAAIFDQLTRYQLEPEIFSFSLLQEFARFLGARETAFPVHINIDTGMHRLGFLPEEIDQLGAALAEYPQLKVVSVFTHLAASDNPAQDEFTHQQARLFEEGYAGLCRRLGYRPLRHLLNSSGISRFPQYQADMVRLGIGLYGVESEPAVREQLEVVAQLKAHIVQVKEHPAGATIGYGRAGRLPEAGRIATVSIGYADGLPRLVGNGKFALEVRGRRAPIIGQVCMDLCMIDISAVPEAREGDEVTVFGISPTVTELAEAAGTIPYEIFTSVSERVRRVYIGA